MHFLSNASEVPPANYFHLANRRRTPEQTARAQQALKSLHLWACAPLLPVKVLGHLADALLKALMEVSLPRDLRPGVQRAYLRAVEHLHLPRGILNAHARELLAVTHLPRTQRSTLLTSVLAQPGIDVDAFIAAVTSGDPGAIGAALRSPHCPDEARAAYGLRLMATDG